MTDINELQRRITAAMDRVAAGLEKVESAPGPDPEIAQALEDERTANAQLNERIRALKAKSDADEAALKAQLEETAAKTDERIAQLDLELQRVRQANKQLTDACAALIEANQEGVGEPHLINKAMFAELEGLRAARAADIAETETILGALRPLLNGVTPPEAGQEETS